MIQANELRIENWITHNNPNLAPKYIRVHSIGEKGINYWPNVEEPAAVKIEFATLEPIPLTPEILEKGFEWSGGDHWSDKENLFWVETRGHDYRFCKPMITPYNLRCLHQLQNLYFALTGTELEINLNP